MDCLPLELRVQILNEIADFPSLHNIILTSRSMYYAFKAQKSSILSSTLRRLLPKPILEDALAVEESSRIMQEESSVSRGMLVKRRLSGRQSEDLSLCKAIDYPSPATPIFDSVVRKLVIVEGLTYELCKELEAKRERLNFTNLPLQSDEKARIYRAFYCLELFRNLLSRLAVHTMHAQPMAPFYIRQRFVSSLHSWEMEELACVHSFLQRRLYNLAASYEDIVIEASMSILAGMEKAELLLHVADKIIFQGIGLLYRFLSTHNRVEHASQLANLDLAGPNPHFLIYLPTFNVWGGRPNLNTRPLASKADILGPNFGWREACHYPVDFSYPGSMNSWVHRCWVWGYAFWSETRFELEDLTGELRNAAQEHIDANPSLAMYQSIAYFWKIQGFVPTKGPSRHHLFIT